MVNQKRNQEETNPCLKEQELSYKCLSMNNYDKDKCQLEFENYKTCKGFWVRGLTYTILQNLYFISRCLYNLNEEGKA